MSLMNIMLFWMLGFVSGYVLCMSIRNYEQRTSATRLLLIVRKLAETGKEKEAAKLINEWFVDLSHGG